MRIVATSGAAAAARTGALQNEASAAVRRGRRDGGIVSSREQRASSGQAQPRMAAAGPGAPDQRWSRCAGEPPVDRTVGPVRSRTGTSRIAQTVDAAASDPLLDYLQRGAARGRDPSPLFSGGWYLEQYPDVRATGMNPLVHFLRYGAREGRNPSPFFETEWYRARYPDVRASGMNPLVHYLRYGAAEGRDPARRFIRSCISPRIPREGGSVSIRSPTISNTAGLQGRRPNSTGRRPPFRHGDTQGANRVSFHLSRLIAMRRGSRAMNSGSRPFGGCGQNLCCATGACRASRSSCRSTTRRDISSIKRSAASSIRCTNAGSCASQTMPAPLPEVGECLERWAAADKRIHVVHRDYNGVIAAATNSAAAIARGEFLAFLDHDDLLSPDALVEIAIHAADHAGE